MKPSRSTVVLALGLCTLTPAPLTAQRNATSLQTPTVITGNPRDVPCAGTPTRHNTGMVRACRLSADHRFGEHVVPAASDVEFSPMGALISARLGRESPFYGQALPARATVFFGADGEVRDFYVHEVAVIQGLPIDDFQQGVGAMLYRSGKLRAVRLARATVVDGVPCVTTAPLFRGFWHSITSPNLVWLFEDGSLEQCLVARDTTVRGESLARGDVVRFDRDGARNRTLPPLDWQGWTRLR